VARAFKKSVEVCIDASKPMLQHKILIDLKELCHSHYAPYVGTLAFGHLSGSVKLHPDPNTTLHISSPNQSTIASLSSMSSLGNSISIPSSLSSSSSKNYRLPSVLTVMGFVSTKNFPSPPSISRHALVPHSYASSSDSTKEDANLSDDALLCSLLYQSLKNEKVTTFFIVICLTMH